MAVRFDQQTMTMARIFAQQGYLRKAAEIYRQLLASNPEDNEARSALRDLETRLTQHPVPSRKELKMLFREWVDWIERSKRWRGNAQQRRNG